MTNDLVRKIFAELGGIAEGSDDPDTQTACIITTHGGIGIATGVNRLPRGTAKTTENTSRPLKYEYLIHAERCAISTAARLGHSTCGSVMLLNWFPCAPCAGLIVESGIQVLVCDEAKYNERIGDSRYGFGIAMELLISGGVQVMFL